MHDVEANKLPRCAQRRQRRLTNFVAAHIDERRPLDPNLFFVADIAGTVVGTVMGGYDGHRGWIYSVATDPGHRRQGIGSALLRRVETALIERGCLKVNLQVRTSNAAVIAFYEKLGYAVEDRVSMGKCLY